MVVTRVYIFPKPTSHGLEFIIELYGMLALFGMGFKKTRDFSRRPVMISTATVVSTNIFHEIYRF